MRPLTAQRCQPFRKQSSRSPASLFAALGADEPLPLHCPARAKIRGGSSLDDFVSAGEDRWWHCQTERAGGLEVAHQLECGRLLAWQISRPAAFQDSRRVTAGLAKGLCDRRTIADQAAGRRELAPCIDRWNGMA